MGIAHLREIVDRLLDLGRDPDEPAALVQMVSTPLQRTIRAPLQAIVEVARRQQITTPATLVVGQSVRFADSLNWFEQRPLFGRRVLVARTRLQISQLAAWMRAKVWAHGPGSVEALRQRGIHPDWACSVDYAAAVACGLLERDVSGHDVFVPCIERQEVLGRDLREMGTRVCELQVAQLDTETSRSEDTAQLQALLDSRSLDACVFPASRSIERIAELLGSDWSKVNTAAVVCMVPRTADTAKRLGARVGGGPGKAARGSVVGKAVRLGG